MTFHFTCDPLAATYVRSSFTLHFPPLVNLAAVPERIWYMAAMLCLHPQWMLLRPCRIELPVRLLRGEAETWLRLMDAGIATLESLRGTAERERTIEIVEGARPMPRAVPIPENGRCATAFSGGKDSLLQAALLSALTPHPLLVATTSPMPPFHDHETDRQRFVFSEIAQRRSVTFVEVQSNLRTMYDNGAAGALGYPIAVSELTDALLYLANLIIVSAALGFTHLFVASEAEVQENDDGPGLPVQHPHFMYSTVTLRAVSALLAPHGMQLSTLTSPLHADSVQRLLWLRHADIAGLQYSCWLVPTDGTACGRCTQCLRIALCAVNAGGDPAEMGVDLTEVMSAHADWTAAERSPSDDARARSRVEIHAQVTHNLQTIGRRRMLHLLGAFDPRRVVLARTRAAIRGYLKLRAAALARPVSTIGWRRDALTEVDPLLRSALADVYGADFPDEPPERYRATLARGKALAEWIAAPFLEQQVGTPVLAAAELNLSADDLRVRALLPARDPELSDAHGPIVPVSAPALDGNEALYVEQAVRSGWISSGGPFVRQFEERFAELTACAHAVACSSGTSALHLTIAALGIGPGDEVIVPTFTMIATANAVAYTGAEPIFVDAHPVTWNLDPAAVSAAVTPRTRAIVVVHTYGAPADMDAIRAIARHHQLVVIEDAAEAHGAAYKGAPVGALGAAATFSFYANKIVTTGEGGMITTNDARFATVARNLRDHAFSADHHFWHRYRGFNYRMTNLQAAVGVAQLERFDALVERRRTLAKIYTAALSGLPGLTLPHEEPDTKNVFWMYSLLVGPEFGCTRDELRAHLAAAGIETRTMFIPMHMQPIYRARERGHMYPVAERLCRTGLYLPTSAALSDADAARVASAVSAARTAPVSSA